MIHFPSSLSIWQKYNIIKVNLKRCAIVGMQHQAKATQQINNRLDFMLVPAADVRRAYNCNPLNQSECNFVI
jgi:hypothetical protein